jgi:hypothetical protein
MRGTRGGGLTLSATLGSENPGSGTDVGWWLFWNVGDYTEKFMSHGNVDGRTAMSAYVGE